MQGMSAGAASLNRASSLSGNSPPASVAFPVKYCGRQPSSWVVTDSGLYQLVLQTAGYARWDDGEGGASNPGDGGHIIGKVARLIKGSTLTLTASSVTLPNGSSCGFTGGGMGAAPTFYGQDFSVAGSLPTAGNTVSGNAASGYGFVGGVGYSAGGSQPSTSNPGAGDGSNGAGPGFGYFTATLMGL